MRLGQDGGGTAGGGLGLGDRLVDEPRRVGQAADELALVGQVHRPELGMGLQEEPVGRSGPVRSMAGQDRVVLRRGDADAEDQQVGLKDEFAAACRRR